MSPIISAIAIGLITGFYAVAELQPAASEAILFVTLSTFSAFAWSDWLDYLSE